jgi:hypothetical protein
MTDKLRELVERLEKQATCISIAVEESVANDIAAGLLEAAAALRELIEQKPVAWRVYSVPTEEWLYTHGNINVYRGEPLYALPVAQPSKEWLDEAMRIHRQAMIASHFHVTEDADRGTAALREHLEKR